MSEFDREEPTQLDARRYKSLEDWGDAGVPKKLGPWLIGENLGYGGFGAVHSATQVHLNTKRAIKILWPQLAQDPDNVKAFLAEAQTLTRLDRNERIVQVYDVDHVGDYCYIVMGVAAGYEVEGKSMWSVAHWQAYLFQQRRDSRLSEGETLQIGLDVLEALAIAHAPTAFAKKGIVHRDVKPANILLNSDGRAMLADFGLAKVIKRTIEEVVEGKSAISPNSASGQAIAGTVRYMSPEQKEREEIDARSDLYSVGVVLYELLTGRLPEGEVPYPYRMGLSCGPWWDDVLRKARSGFLEDRWQSAEEMRNALLEGKVEFEERMAKAEELAKQQREEEEAKREEEARQQEIEVERLKREEERQESARLAKEENERQREAKNEEEKRKAQEKEQERESRRVKGQVTRKLRAQKWKLRIESLRNQKEQVVRFGAVGLVLVSVLLVITFIGENRNDSNGEQKSPPIASEEVKAVVNVSEDEAVYFTKDGRVIAEDGKKLGAGELFEAVQELQSDGRRLLADRLLEKAADWAERDVSKAEFLSDSIVGYSSGNNFRYSDFVNHRDSVVDFLYLEESWGLSSILDRGIPVSFETPEAFDEGEKLSVFNKESDVELSLLSNSCERLLAGPAPSFSVIYLREEPARGGSLYPESSHRELRFIRTNTVINDLLRDTSAESDAGKEIGVVVQGRDQDETESQEGVFEPSQQDSKLVEPKLEGDFAGQLRKFEIADGVQMSARWCPATTSEEWKRLKGKETFTMGSPKGEEGRKTDESSQEVQLTSGFWLSKTEVTQGQWEAVMGTTVREQRGEADSEWSLIEGANYPMYYVNWEEVETFTHKLKRMKESGWEWRLPSEAEWEYASLAGSKDAYSFGNKSNHLGQYARFGGDWKSDGPRKVGGLRANNWGLQDMYGNVWEWCADWYHAEYKKAEELDLEEPSTEARRVYRGGSWGDARQDCRSANRKSFVPSRRSKALGFRLALSPVQADREGAGRGLEDPNGWLESGIPEGKNAGEERDFEMASGIVITMCWCPATTSEEWKKLSGGKDTFTMGSPAPEEGRDDDETQHEVKLTKGFWLGSTEVTQGQWEAVMGQSQEQLVDLMLADETKYRFGTEEKTNREYWADLFGADYSRQLKNFAIGPNYPVYCVNWIQAEGYCRRVTQRLRGELGKVVVRLPTEAEWEFACRAGSGEATYVGNLTIKGKYFAPELDEIAWYGGNSSVGYPEGLGYRASWGEKQYPGGRAGPREMEQKRANTWGLWDMIGNVDEWTSDWYGLYSEGVVKDPSGPLSGTSRVSRGGTWISTAVHSRSSYRLPLMPTTRNNYRGFRIALQVPVSK